MYARTISVIAIAVLMTAACRADHAGKTRHYEKRHDSGKTKQQTEYQRQKTERAGFKKDMKDLSPEERRAAISARRDSRHEEEMARLGALTLERITEVIQDDTLTEEQKSARTSALVRRHRATVAKLEAKHRKEAGMLDAAPDERDRAKDEMLMREKERKAEIRKQKKQHHMHQKMKTPAKYK